MEEIDFGSFWQSVAEIAATPPPGRPPLEIPQKVERRQMCDCGGFMMMGTVSMKSLNRMSQTVWICPDCKNTFVETRLL